MEKRTGRCLCGAVKVTANLKSTEIQACHCRQCQQWTGGGPHLVVNVDGVEIEGEENISIYRASTWGERGNCSICGSILFWKMQGRAHNSIAIGLLDDQSGLTMSEEIFTDHRPGWLHPWEAAEQSTEAQEQEKLRVYLERQKNA